MKLWGHSGKQKKIPTFTFNDTVLDKKNCITLYTDFNSGYPYNPR